MAEESAAAAKRREAAEKGRRKLDEFRARKAAGIKAKQESVRDSASVASSASKVDAPNGDTPPPPPPIPAKCEPATACVESGAASSSTGEVDASPPTQTEPAAAANPSAQTLQGSGTQPACSAASVPMTTPPPPPPTPPQESVASEIPVTAAAEPTPRVAPPFPFTGSSASLPDSISSPSRSTEVGNDEASDKTTPAVDVDGASKEASGRAPTPSHRAQASDVGAATKPAPPSPPRAPAPSKPWAPPPPPARSLPKSHTLPAFSAVVPPNTSTTATTATNAANASAGSNHVPDSPVLPPIPLVTARASSYAALSDAYLDNPAPPPPPLPAGSAFAFSVANAPPTRGLVPPVASGSSKPESASLARQNPAPFASSLSSSFPATLGVAGAHERAPSLPPLKPVDLYRKPAGGLLASPEASLATCAPASPPATGAPPSPAPTDPPEREELPTDALPHEHAHAASSSYSSSSAVSATRDAAREAKRGISWLAKMIAPPAPPAAGHVTATTRAPPGPSGTLSAPVSDVESTPSNTLAPHSLAPPPTAPPLTTATLTEPKASLERISLSSEVASVAQSAASFGVAAVEDSPPDSGGRRASVSQPSSGSHVSPTRGGPDPDFASGARSASTASAPSRAPEKPPVSTTPAGSSPAPLPSASSLLAHPRANAKPLLFPTSAAKPKAAAQPPRAQNAGGDASTANGSASPPLQGTRKGLASDACAHVLNPLAPSPPAPDGAAQPSTKSEAAGTDAAPPRSVQASSPSEQGGDEHDAVARKPQGGDAIKANGHSNGHVNGLDGSHSASKSDLRDTQRDRSQFAELQQYIDDLTREKYDLERALQQHSRLMETMHEENNALAEQFNAQGRKVAALQEKVGQYESEIAAQGVVLGSLSVQREEAQRGNTDAHERARALAQEVVDLEEKNLALSSRELKAQHELKSAREELEQRRRALKTVEADRLDLRAAVAALQEEQRMLTSRLRLAALNSELPIDQESRRGATEASIATAAAPLLAADHILESGTEPHAGGASSEAAANQEGVAADDWLGGGPRIPEVVQVDPGVAPAEARVAVMEADPCPTALQERVSDNEPMDIPQVQGISKVLGREGAFMRLAELLEGPATIGTDHMAMIENIHSLLSEFEKQQQETLTALQMTQAEAAALRKQNDHLSKSLDSQTQRLELVIQKSMVEGKGQQLASSTTSLATDLPHEGELDVDAEGQVMVDNMIGWMLKFLGGRRRKSAPLK